MDPKVLEWCKRLIGTASVTDSGTRRVAEFCANELLPSYGMSARLIPSTCHGAEQMNLLAVIEGREPALAPILLNTHLDTVPPGDPGLWRECDGNPFAPVVKGDRIYGLGAADTKLDFIAKVVGLAECGRPRRTVYLVGTFGEEHGLRGARELAEAHELPARALAFVGEPSGLKIVTAHKGLLVSKLIIGAAPRPQDPSRPLTTAIFAGRSAHSSTPGLGSNAILTALAALASQPDLEIVAIDGGDAVNKVPATCRVVLGESPKRMLSNAAIAPVDDSAYRNASVPHEAIAALHQFVTRLQGYADRTGPEEPDLPSPTLTCNPGVLRTDETTMTLEFELRPPPALPITKVRSGIEALAADVAAGFPELSIDLVEDRANASFRSALDSEVVEIAADAMARAGLPIEFAAKAGCTEAGVYAAAGLHPVVFGPGPSTGVIHAPNEYNKLSEIDGAIRFYRALLEA